MGVGVGAAAGVGVGAGVGAVAAVSARAAGPDAEAEAPAARPAHAGPPAGRGARRKLAVEVVAWAKAMRARSAPLSVDS